MKFFMSNRHRCLDCNVPISEKVNAFSSLAFGLSLCIPCQNRFNEKSANATAEARALYVALRKRNVPAELEKYDGYKTIDIAVTHAKVNIEVDGLHHNFEPDQALADLQRTYYSFKKGYLTLRVPNALLQYHLERTADYITEFLNESRDKLVYN